MKLLLWVAVFLLPPTAAFAQGNPGPFGGLFGRAPQRTGLDYRLFEIRGSTGVEWNSLLSKRRPESPEPPFAGLIASTATGATYDRRSDRLDLRAGTHLEFRRSLESRQTRGTTVGSGVLLTSRPTTRVSAEVNANYLRSPFYQFFPTFAWLGDGVVVPDAMYDVQPIENHLADARVSGSFQYSKRSTLTASVQRAESWFPTSANNDFSLSHVEGLWRRRLNRDFVVRLGYGHREIRHHTLVRGNLVEEQIDAGVDFHRALTLSPRTTVAFTTHTSILRQPDREPRYRLNGEFHLARQFRRTWRLDLDARRSTEFLAGFVEPLFAHALDLSLSGLLSTRIEVLTTVRASHGRFGYEGERDPFTMTGSMTRLNIALTRNVGIYSQYGFYYHNAPRNPLAITTVGELSRQTFTTGIAAWLPVYTRERMPLDPR